MACNTGVTTRAEERKRDAVSESANIVITAKGTSAVVQGVVSNIVDMGTLDEISAALEKQGYNVDFEVVSSNLDLTEPLVTSNAPNASSTIW